MTPRQEPLTGFLADLDEANRRAVWTALCLAAFAMAATAWAAPFTWREAS
jgi:hypothetical protein